MHNELKEALTLLGKDRKHDALLMLENHKTGKKRFIWGRNIITNAGDVYYSQKVVGVAPTNTFANLYLATAGPTPVVKTNNYGDFTVVAGSEKAPTALYPQLSDPDTDNTGSGVNVVSWKHAYIMADGPFTAIQWSFIAKAGAGGTDPILNSYKWTASWSKDVNTSAKIFTNHTLLGV